MFCWHVFLSHLTGQPPKDGSSYKHSLCPQRQGLQHIRTCAYASIKIHFYSATHSLYDLRQGIDLLLHRHIMLDTEWAHFGLLKLFSHTKKYDPQRRQSSKADQFP